MGTGSLRKWMLGGLIASLLAGCVTIGAIGQGELTGKVLVEWYRQDLFIYRKTAKPLRFKPSFMDKALEPADMLTDGGSVPQILWGIPGLSPWALGPAYVIHDWVFRVHRCRFDVPGKDMTFEQSAQVLAEVGKALIDAGVIDDDMLGPITWAVRTRIARDLWDRPPRPGECDPPPAAATARASFGQPQAVYEFEIPRRR